MKYLVIGYALLFICQAFALLAARRPNKNPFAAGIQTKSRASAIQSLSGWSMERRSYAKCKQPKTNSPRQFSFLPRRLRAVCLPTILRRVK
jgi:hypothetical protein